MSLFIGVVTGRSCDTSFSDFSRHGQERTGGNLASRDTVHDTQNIGVARLYFHRSAVSGTP